jgi:hypothetical protein
MCMFSTQTGRPSSGWNPRSRWRKITSSANARSRRRLGWLGNTNMKSALRGKTISAVEVSSLGPDGFWLLVDERELFVPFKEFPWFQDARIREIMAVERPSPHHLRWPDLDIDLAIGSIEHPDRFPLLSKVRPDEPTMHRPRPARVRAKKIATPARRRPRR